MSDLQLKNMVFNTKNYIINKFADQFVTQYTKLFKEFAFLLAENFSILLIPDEGDLIED